MARAECSSVSTIRRQVRAVVCRGDGDHGRWCGRRTGSRAVAPVRGAACGRGVDRWADRQVPGLGPLAPAVCRLSPDRAARPAPRRGGRAALVRPGPGRQDRLDQPAAPAIRRAPGDLPAKTPHSTRVIALDRTTVAALAGHRDRQRAEAAAFGPGYRDSGFTCLNGDPMAPDRLTRTFKKLTALAGLPPIRLHDRPVRMYRHAEPGWTTPICPRQASAAPSRQPRQPHARRPGPPLTSAGQLA